MLNCLILGGPRKTPFGEDTRTQIRVNARFLGDLCSERHHPCKPPALHPENTDVLSKCISFQIIGEKYMSIHTWLQTQRGMEHSRIRIPGRPQSIVVWSLGSNSYSAIFLAVWFLERDLISLGSNFLICKMGITVVPIPLGHCNNSNNSQKTQNHR